ncbi:transducin/WD40 repeat-like superfamily protein [Actinidia rufa]|uniref:Transducin/WD40 repeat-like superfamily protein n=1 Tax=Actinidia rufa TaxID=165716 RepID=A0A7J0F5F4_9ERIC|nr:transducin/WD40 repeat-like superfamily protein [Actinidia rufa]GFY93833.1 transducin/WD40 repeat-like superfamily protein [Actinidia rufa]
MEWATLQHLDLRHPGRSSKPLQPHAAAFHPTQAIVATAVGNYITEFDVYTGSKIASIDIGSPVVQMAYSPVSGHTVIAILEVSFLNKPPLMVVFGYYMIFKVIGRTLHSTIWDHSSCI